MTRLALLLLALTFTLATACNRGVPSKEEVEGGSTPTAEPPEAMEAPVIPATPATPTPPAQVNTLPNTAPAAGAPGVMAPGMHPAQESTPASVTVAPGSITPAEGGLTVRDIFAQRTDLAGKSVTVRGKVVKAMQGVMGTNWYHIQDGTGDNGTNDLVITSDASTKVGDTVLVVGTLASDKDLGMGYHYDAIVEKAEVKVESSEAPSAPAAPLEGAGEQGMNEEAPMVDDAAEPPAGQAE